jgi:hypothetical protein
MFGHDPEYTDAEDPIDYLGISIRCKATAEWNAAWGFRTWVFYVPVDYDYAQMVLGDTYVSLNVWTSWITIESTTNAVVNFITEAPWSWDDFDNFAFGFQKYPGVPGDVNDIQFTQVNLNVYYSKKSSQSNAVWYFGI